MNREPSVINIICFITKQVKELGVHDCYHKVECVIGITDDDKHGCSLIADHIQFHLVIQHDFS